MNDTRTANPQDARKAEDAKLKRELLEGERRNRDYAIQHIADVLGVPRKDAVWIYENRKR